MWGKHQSYANVLPVSVNSTVEPCREYRGNFSKFIVFIFVGSSFLSTFNFTFTTVKLLFQHHSTVLLALPHILSSSSLSRVTHPLHTLFIFIYLNSSNIQENKVERNCFLEKMKCSEIFLKDIKEN